MSSTEDKKPAKKKATKVTEPFKSKKVVYTETFGKLNLIEYEGVEQCDGAYMIEGVPSVSLTSILAANFLVDQLELQVVGAMTCQDLTPRVVVDKGRPHHAIRIMGNKDLVVILCEFKLTPVSMWHLVDAIASFAKRHKIKSVITIEGLPKEALPDSDDEDEDGALVATDDKNKKKKKKELTPEEQAKKDAQLHFCTNSDEVFKFMTSEGHKPVVSGVIDGLTGGLLAQASTDGFEASVTAILAPVSQMDPGAGAAALVVKCLDKLMTDVSIDVSPLELKSNELQSQIAKIIAQGGMSGRGPPPGSMGMYT